MPDGWGPIEGLARLWLSKDAVISKKPACRLAEHFEATLAPATKPPSRQRDLTRVVKILFMVGAQRLRQTPVTRDQDQFLVDE